MQYACRIARGKIGKGFDLVISVLSPESPSGKRICMRKNEICLTSTDIIHYSHIESSTYSILHIYANLLMINL